MDTRGIEFTPEPGFGVEGRSGRGETLSGDSARPSHGLRQRAGEAAARGAESRDEIRARKGEIEQQIRANPLISIGVALGAGYLLGRLLD